MELMTYKTRAVRTLSLLILVAMLAALTPPSITGGSALAQTATTPEITSFSADTANQVSLTWSAVTDADNYQVWRWESAENWVELDGSFEGTTYTDTTVTAGKTYYYQVSADGGSTWSNRVSATVGAYDASTLAAPTATSTAVSLSWGAVTGATSYELWRYENSWIQVGGALTATTYSDSSVEIGKTYYYQVMAKGPLGDGAWSNRVSATVPSTTPGMPLNLNAAAGDAQVVLTWNVPATDGGSALTGYQYRYQMAGGSWSSWMATSPALSRTATVTGLTNETAHNFEVQAMNTNGASPSATASATPMSTPPGIPSGLGTTSTGPTEITLSWTAAAGAASYQLQRRTNGGSWGSPMDAGSGTTYTDSGLTPSTTYDYEVRAVNPAGESDWSAVVTAATTDPTAPDMPSLTATAGATNIMLAWTAPDSNGADISGYDIDVSGDGSAWSDLSTPAAGDTSYNHTPLDPGTMNYYRIRAMNSVGYSDWSASEMATVPAVAPDKPSLTATADGTTIKLSWIAPASNGGAAITGYTVQVSSTGTSGWGTLANKAAADTSHDHTGLAAGTTRYYQISATNSAGLTSAWSDLASATTAGAAPPRGGATDTSSPRNLSVTKVDLDSSATQGTSTASLTVAWLVPSDPPDDGEATTDLAYQVQVWNPTTQVWDAVADDDDTSPLTLTHSGRMGTTEYTYRVRAVDGTRMGTWSTQESGTTVAVSPGKPTLTATAADGLKINLTWSVANDGGSDVIGYIVAVSATAPVGDADLVSPGYLDAGGNEQSGPVLLEAVPLSLAHAMAPGPVPLVAGATWYYQVSAVNSVVDLADPLAANAAWGAWSAVAMATVKTGPPPDTGLFTLTPSANTVTISYTPSTATGGSPFTSHEIQVYDAAKDTWTILRDSLDVTDYVHSGLDANVKMTYRARGKNALGAGPWITRSTTTPAGAPSAPKLTATVNGPDSITLSWTAPNDGGTAITGYIVEASETEDPFTALTGTDAAGLADREATDVTLTATHTDLSAGDTRYYRVRATNGTEGANSNIVSATTTTGGVPAAPAWDTTAALTPTATTVMLDWDAPAGTVTGYDIAIWENGRWTIIARNIPTDPTSYLISDLSGGTRYYFSIRGINANGPGTWSDPEDTTTTAGAPGKPVLTVTPDGPTTLKLSWTLDNDGGTAVTSYDVQVSNNGTTGWNSPEDDDDPATGAIIVEIATLSGQPAPAMSYDHTGLTGMTKKFYRVRADNTTEGPWSDVVSATTPAGKPAIVVLSNPPSPELADKFVLTWTKPATGGSAITGYQIQVWEDGAWMDLISVGGSVTTYTHQPIPGATTKYYRVRAMNAVGDGPWSLTQTRLTVVGKPGASVLHASANGTTEIRLTWTAAATGEPSGSTGITFYHIQVSNDGQSAWTAPETSTTIVDGERVHPIAGSETLTYRDTELDPASTKYYRVRAVNAQGEGPWSNVAMAMTAGGTPGKPKLTATKSGTSMINLGWTPPEGDGGSAITGYELQYWDGSNGWMALTTTTASVTAHTHRNIAGGMTKYYRIRAVNDGGNGLWSTIAYATTDTAAPSPPTLMAMKDGANKIKLTWTAGHDGGLTITAYNVQHSSDAGRSWAPLGTVSGLSTEDTGLSGGTTKHYRINAVNSKGTSGWSPLASATTDRSVPGRPTLLARSLPEAVYLNWASPATATGGSAITRYEIQRWDSAERRWVDVRSTTGTAYTDSGLMNGKKYYYRVRAVNGLGAGKWSTFQHATPAAN